MENDVVGRFIQESLIGHEPLLDGFRGVGVLDKVELFGLAIGIFDENAIEGVETPVSIPTASQVNLAAEFMDYTAEFDAGFVFKVDAEVIIREHINLHIKNDYASF